VSESPTALDLVEQLTRIQLMEADIAVEQQTLRIAPRQVVVGFMLGVGAILAAVFTGLKLFLGK
jgi:hypothetical protein